MPKVLVTVVVVVDVPKSKKRDKVLGLMAMEGCAMEKVRMALDLSQFVTREDGIEQWTVGDATIYEEG